MTGAELQEIVTARGNRGGGEVVLPSDPVLITAANGLEVPANVRLRNGSLVRSGAAATVIKATSVAGVSLHNVTIDIAQTVNFQSAIWLVSCTGARILDCTITNSGTPADGDTLHAVLASTCTDLVIADCDVTKAQIKIGSGGGSDQTVRNCTVTNAYNCGISCVTFNTLNVISDVLIEDCRVLGHRDAGIFIGSDNGAVASGTTRDIAVRRCTIAGQTHGDSVGVLARLGLISTDWRFEDITVEMTYDVARPLQNARGLQITNANDGLSTGQRIWIERVVQNGRTAFGIEVRGGVDDIRVDHCSAVDGVRYHADHGNISRLQHIAFFGPVYTVESPPYTITYAS